MIDCALSFLANYGVYLFLTVGCILCISIQVCDFINWISGDNESE